MDANRFITHSLRDSRIARIFAASIDAVEPGELVREYLQKADLPKHDRVFLLGIGKASESMNSQPHLNLLTISPMRSLSRSTHLLRPISGSPL